MTLTEIRSELHKETKRINEAIAAVEKLVVEKLIKAPGKRKGGPSAVLSNRLNSPK